MTLQNSWYIERSKGAFDIAILLIKSAILNKIGENELFGNSFFKNCNLGKNVFFFLKRTILKTNCDFKDQTTILSN